jgi:hypothetical protein
MGGTSQETVAPLLSAVGPIFGTATIGASAVAVLDASQHTDIGVRVKADDDNSGSIYLGNSSAVLTSTGWRLKAGQELELFVSDVGQIFAIASGAGQKLYWMAR